MSGVLSFFAAEAGTRWHNVSDFEGARGFLVVGLTLVGLAAGFGVGAGVGARRRAAASAAGFARALGLAAAVAAGSVLVPTALAWITMERPLLVDGRALDLQFELRLPTAFPPAENLQAQGFTASLYVSDRDNRFATLDWAAAAERDGHLIVPGRAHLRTARASRSLLAGATWPSQVFDVHLPARPGDVHKTWSEWTGPRSLADGKPVPEDAAYQLRYRVVEWTPEGDGADDEVQGELPPDEGAPEDEPAASPRGLTRLRPGTARPRRAGNRPCSPAKWLTVGGVSSASRARSDLPGAVGACAAEAAAAIGEAAGHGFKGAGMLEAGSEEVGARTARRGLRPVRRALLVGAVVLTATPAAAQPQGVQWPEWQPTFRTKRTLVTIDCVVTDRNGRHVTDLTADDFEITVDRTRQPVRQAAFVPLGTDSFVQTAAPLGAEAAPSSRAPLASSPIRADARATRRVLALVIDDLGLSFESTVGVRNALERFIDRQVEPGDLVAILRTAGGIGALQQFTTDRRLMHAAANRVQWTILSRSGVSAFTPVSPPGATGAPTASGSGTAENDNEDTIEGLRTTMLAAASLDALEYVVRGVEHLPGRKAVVFFSEGFRLLNRPKGFGSGGNTRVWNAFTRLMDRANRAGVVVYTVDSRGLTTGRLTAEDNPQSQPAAFAGGPPGAAGTPASVAFQAQLSASAAERTAFLHDSQQALHFVAQQTGGFAIVNTNDLNLGLERVLNDLAGYYLLGYDEPEGAERRTWEPGRIVVRVKRPGLAVRSRGGLFGPGLGDRPREPEHHDPVVAAALSPFGASDIPVRLTALFGFDAGRRAAYARALLFVDVNGVTFALGDDGRHEAKLDVLQIAVGDNGALLADWRRTITLSLSDEQLRDARTRGVVYSTRMPVKKPGAYQVRVAIRDMSTAALGSASQFLEIPETGKGRLAVSGVLVRAADGEASAAETAATDLARDDEDRLSSGVLGEPSVRIFEPGNELVYAYEIYDGLRGEAAERLQMSTSLLRDGRVVYESPWTPVKTARGDDDVRVLPIAGKMSLGADVPPGAYTLQVNVAADRTRRAAQWVDFEVRPGATP